MRVTFVLPGFKSRPVGGFLTVYKYANALVKHGHDVTVVHAMTTSTIAARKRTRMHLVTKRATRRLRPKWFVLDDRVTVCGATDLREREIPQADIVFATACTTAPAVASLGSSRGQKAYLIQSYEDWVCDRELVDMTWRLPMTKVVVSRNLYQRAIEMGLASTTFHVSNGVEVDIFRLDCPIDDRPSRRVGFLAHSWPVKGLPVAIEAMELLRLRVPEVEVVAFGVGARPPMLPSWIQYRKNLDRPALRAYYNSLAVFLHSSFAEGWGLTCAEAMACGCALVATDSGGIRDFAYPGETAHLVTPGDAHGLARAAQRVIENRDERVRLATRGVAVVSAFTWERAGAALDAVIREVAGPEEQIGSGTSIT